MPEYFIVANSFAAPFVSDDSTGFEAANSPESALVHFVKYYEHPAGLYAAAAYASANDYHKGKPPLAQWLSNHELAKQGVTKEKGSYMYESHGPGKFQVDSKGHDVDDPKGGKVITIR